MRTASKSKARRQRPSRSANNGKGRAKKLKSVESVAFRFLTEHAKELEGYPGEVLLIHGAGLIAHSPDMAVIKKAIADHMIESPFIYRVATPEEANFIF